ncbi:hypothetical protein EDD17DRAFT_1545827, partial [Pisolithus thermaeus]
ISPAKQKPASLSIKLICTPVPHDWSVRASRQVEIDGVGMVCLETGLRLKSEWEGICEIQTAAFDRKPTSIDVEAPGENFELLAKALDHPGVSVVGSAPWVEPSRKKAYKNVAEILALSKAGNLHAPR